MQLSDRLGRRMKLQDLHILMTVVQAGTMGKAAKRLNTVQPAVSRSIAELEHALGVRLLDRHRQGVEPTEYGRALLDGGLAAFDELRQAVKKIEFLADPAAGEVRIGCSAFLAASFVTAVVDRLSRRYPRIVFHVVAANTETLHRELSERNVDLVVARRSDFLADKQFEFQILYDELYAVVAGARNPLVRRRRIELAELVNESWVLPPPQGVLGSVIREAFSANAVDYPRVTVVTLVREVRIGLVATGRFLSIVPISVLKFPIKRPEVRILPVELSIARVPVDIVTLKNRTVSPVARLFIEHAREVAKPLAQRRR